MLFYVDSHDCECYISLTSDRKLNKNAGPCQVVANKLTIERLPSQFQTTHELERILVSRNIFQKSNYNVKKSFSYVKGKYVQYLTLKEIACHGLIVVE